MRKKTDKVNEIKESQLKVFVSMIDLTIHSFSCVPNKTHCCFPVKSEACQISSRMCRSCKTLTDEYLILR